jgi:imidazolonepropionase-like amidohydrolase
MPASPLAAPGRYHLSGAILPSGEERDVWIVDGLVSFERRDDCRTIATNAYLLPGLVDAHAHLALSSPAPPEAGRLEQIRASGRAQLAAGVLALREPGGPDRSSAGLGPDDGMPRVQSAGHLLSPPGTYIPRLSRPAAPDALPDIAVEEARASGAWVKIVGDFPGRNGRTAVHYQPDVLAETARRVHAVGGRVAIHANLPQVIEAAIAGGLDSIEHGAMVQSTHLGAMAARGVALVPTLLIREPVRSLLRWAGIAADELADWDRALERQPEVVRRAVEAGVTVLAGTDAGMGPHGRIRDEIEQLLAAGVRPDAAIGAGSWTARAYLGLPGIEDGAPADVVAYARDPRADPSVLGAPLAIVLAGRLLGPAADH